jgi:hypothetical protein
MPVLILSPQRLQKTWPKFSKTEAFMKKNFWTVFSAPCVGAGVVLLALCAFTPSSHAAVILNNLPSAGFTSTGSTSQGTSVYVGETFTMGASGDTLGSVTLSLNFTASDSAHVYFYNTTFSGGIYTPTGAGTLLGTVSDTSATISGLNISLVAGTTYAIALGPQANSGSADMAWNNISTSGTVAGSEASPVGYFSGNGSIWGANNTGPYLQMQLDPVPEVPLTGLCMGFGALAIAIGHTLRRKLRRVAANAV